MEQGKNCIEDGPPQKGEAVQIQWTDGDLYDAVFRRENKQDVYTVSLTRLKTKILFVSFWFTWKFV